MQKDKIIDFSTAFTYCYEKAKANVIKNMGLNEEDLEYEEDTTFKHFCNMHPNLNADDWRAFKEDTALFTRRIEYILAAKHI